MRTTDRTEEPGAPRRVQLSREAGWRMPPNTVKVDRTTKWGNHFVVLPGRSGYDAIMAGSPIHCLTAHEAVARFRLAIELKDMGSVVWAAIALNDMEELRGKNLACWCKVGDPCHADVLLEEANR